MTPDSGRRVGIVAEQDEALRLRRRTLPIQRRRDILAVAGEFAWDFGLIGEGRGSYPHLASPSFDSLSARIATPRDAPWLPISIDSRLVTVTGKQQPRHIRQG
jgi:hypothetical protein